MNSVSNRFRQGVCLLLALLLVCLLGSACAADSPFYFTWPLVNGSWDYNFPVNVYTSQGDYWQNWEGKGAPYYNDYITYITGGYWWLRDSTTRKNDANRVRPHGNVEEYGGNTNAYGVGVRPALWISLDLF